jgi:transposase
MWNAVALRDDFTASTVRDVAGRAKDATQVRRLLAIAAVYDGMDREAAARIGGMDRQTLRDWVHRFNALGPEGLVDRWAGGPKPRLTPEQKEELARLVEAGPDLATEGIVRWRCLDLKEEIRKRFGVDYHERTVGKLLKELGFSHVSARPRHPRQKPETVEDFKKTSRGRWRRP